MLVGHRPGIKSSTNAVAILAQVWLRGALSTHKLKSCLTAMAPSPGARQLLCWLSVLLHVPLQCRADCHASTASEHTEVWPRLGRRDRRLLTECLTRGWNAPRLEIMTGFGLGLWSPPEVVLKKRCRRLFKQQRLSWRAVPIGASVVVGMAFPWLPHRRG